MENFSQNRHQKRRLCKISCRMSNAMFNDRASRCLFRNAKSSFSDATEVQTHGYQRYGVTPIKYDFANIGNCGTRFGHLFISSSSSRFFNKLILSVVFFSKTCLFTNFFDDIYILTFTQSPLNFAFLSICTLYRS